MPLLVGILGATGAVGQKFIQLLDGHPWFVVHALGAGQSAGKIYKEGVSWKLTTPIPEAVKFKPIFSCEPANFAGCHLIFSALDASVAGEIEMNFAKSGFPVFSNAKNHRYDRTVPILVPQANASHIDIIPAQKAEKQFPGNGYIITNANCSSTGLVVALKPLLDKFGLSKLLVFTMQAVSGAGYPGVASLDIVDNVIPFISGEEPKMEMEPQKILGSIKENQFQPASFVVSAHCNRTCVIDGHTECVSIKFQKENVPVEEVIAALKNYMSEVQELKLPSAPPRPIQVLEEDNRPQPRLDRDLGRGFVVTVGRVRECPIFDVKLTLCSHNTVIGAAGGSIQCAELAVVKKYLPDPNAN